MNETAESHTLYIDMDRVASPKLAPIFAACRIVGVSIVWTAIRRTKNGWHIIIRLRDQLEPAEIIALQVLCGSDNRRECLNLMRVLGIRRTPIRDPFWKKRWNLLYSHKL